MRYASWAFVFVNTLLKSDAKIRTFSDAAKFILPVRGIVVFLQPEKRYNR